MTLITTFFNKFTVFLDFNSMKALGLIDTDYSLIRYLIKNVLFRYSISTNLSGYLQAENCNNSETLIHRIILRYYSQFDTKLLNALNNKIYEVNHKNKCVWDNRLYNLELVTSENNKKHRDNKNYSTYISSEYLLNIQRKLNENNKYTADKKYLQKISRELKTELAKEHPRKINMYYHYLIFNNITKHIKQNSISVSDINTLSMIQNTFFLFNKYNIFINFINKFDMSNIIQYSMYFSTQNNVTKYDICLKLFINKITYLYNKTILHNIINNNIKLLDKYKNKYLDQLLKTYNIYNTNPTYSKNKYVHEYNLDFIEQNILLNLYRMLLHGNIHFYVYKNCFLTNISIKDCFINYKKHESFRIMYFLNILTKQKIPKKSINWFKSLDSESKLIYVKRSIYHDIHSPSFFKITEFTKETIIEANKKAKSFINSNINKVTHFIIEENFDSSTAESVFRNPICTKHSKKASITKEDIISIINNLAENVIKTSGYITVDDIWDELERINNIRKNDNQNFNIIHKNCTKFIRSSLKNIPEIKNLLNKLNLVYKPLNKLTLNNIIKYQKNDYLSNIICCDLSIRKEIIILKKLYKGGTKNGKAVHNKRNRRVTA